jgi:Holliday junction DNA helicase RuvA
MGRTASHTAKNPVKRVIWVIFILFGFTLSKIKTFLILAALSKAQKYFLQLVIAFIDGKLVQKTPTYVVIDCGGVGYSINISLHTYEKIGNDERLRLFTQLIVKEDSHTLYGFADEEERILFNQLISVSGVGTNTARLMLSSLKPLDIRQAITTDNWALIKTVKGIGEKTAQKVVIDLKNKIKGDDLAGGISLLGNRNVLVEEALAALVMLGFSKNEAEKGLQKVRQQNPQYTVEELVKNTLKIL